MDILERADVPLYSSDDDAADADDLTNLPVLAKALLPPPLLSEATGPTAVPAAAQPSSTASAGCDASHRIMAADDADRGRLCQSLLVFSPLPMLVLQPVHA